MSRIFVSLFIVSAFIAHMCDGQGSPMCEENSEPRPCGKLCESTCAKPEKILCNPANKEGCKNECRCVDGYVRHEGQCIRVADCPTVKPPQRCSCNETLALCGTLCEPTCTTPKPKLCPRIQCTKSTEGCRCKEGHLRDLVTKKCVLKKDCVTCGVNEQVGACGRICEDTCKDQDPGKCAAISCTGYGCMCKQGFYRNEETGECGRVKQCPKPKKCDYGEIYAPCGKTCEGTCKSPRLPKICLQIKCPKQECRCDLDAGYVRYEDTKRCIHKNKCPYY